MIFYHLFYKKGGAKKFYWMLRILIFGENFLHEVQ
jgi:hypothetical protein